MQCTFKFKGIQSENQERVSTCLGVEFFFALFWCSLSLLFTIRNNSPLLLIQLYCVDNYSIIYASKDLESLLYMDRGPVCCRANERCPRLKKDIDKIKIIWKILFLM